MTQNADIIENAITYFKESVHAGDALKVFKKYIENSTDSTVQNLLTEIPDDPKAELKRLMQLDTLLYILQWKKNAPKCAMSEITDRTIEEFVTQHPDLNDLFKEPNWREREALNRICGIKNISTNADAAAWVDPNAADAIWHGYVADKRMDEQSDKMIPLYTEVFHCRLAKEGNLRHFRQYIKKSDLSELLTEINDNPKAELERLIRLNVLLDVLVAFKFFKSPVTEKGIGYLINKTIEAYPDLENIFINVREAISVDLVKTQKIWAACSSINKNAYISSEGDADISSEGKVAKSIVTYTVVFEDAVESAGYLKTFRQSIEQSSFRTWLIAIPEDPKAELKRLIQLDLLLNVLNQKKMDPTSEMTSLIKNITGEILGQYPALKDIFSDVDIGTVMSADADKANNIWKAYNDNMRKSKSDSTIQYTAIFKVFIEGNLRTLPTYERYIKQSRFRAWLTAIPDDPKAELNRLIRLDLLLCVLMSKSKHPEQPMSVLIKDNAQWILANNPYLKDIFSDVGIGTVMSVDAGEANTIFFNYAAEEGSENRKNLMVQYSLGSRWFEDIGDNTLHTFKKYIENSDLKELLIEIKDDPTAELKRLIQLDSLLYILKRKKNFPQHEMISMLRLAIQKITTDWSGLKNIFNELDWSIRVNAYKADEIWAEYVKSDSTLGENQDISPESSNRAFYSDAARQGIERAVVRKSKYPHHYIEVAQIKKAEDVLANCKWSIDSSCPWFGTLHSIKEIEDAQRESGEKLTRLENAPEVRNALGILGLSDLPQDIKAYLEKAKAKIKKEADERQKKLPHEQALNEALTVLDSCVKQIKAVTISFDDLDSTDKVEARRKELTEKLTELTSTQEVKDALKLSENHHDDIWQGLVKKVTGELNDKKYKVKDAFEKINKSLRNNEILRSCEQRVNDFSISFSGLASQKAVQAREKELTDALTQLMTPKEVVSALGVPELRELSDSIKQSFEKQKDLIQQQAAEQKQAIHNQDVKSAQEVLDSCQIEIQAFDISFSGLESDDAVQGKERELNGRLGQLESDERVASALVTLELQSLPGPTQNALSEKKKLIREKADEQKQAIRDNNAKLEAEAALVVCEQQIKQLVISFDGLESEEEVRVSQKKLTEALDLLTNTDKVLSALDVLGLKGLSGSIQKSLNEQKDLIQHKADKQKQVIRDNNAKLEAEAALVICEQQIKQLDISFDGLESQAQVEDRERDLNGKLNQLTNTQKVKSALATLGSQSLAESIQKSLNEQKDLIQHKADKQKQVIRDNNAKLEAEAALVICEQQIKQLDISFDGLESEEAVRGKEEELNRQLDQFASEEKVVSALGVLGLKGLSGSIQKSLNEQKGLIQQKADAQKQVIRDNNAKLEAEAALVICEQQIKQLDISFDGLESEEAVRGKEEKLNRQLDQFASEEKVVSALGVLRLQSLPESIQKSLNEKKELILLKKLVVQIFVSSGFDKHLGIIRIKAEKLQTKAMSKESYRTAASAAETLYQDLLRAEETLKDSDEKPQAARETFTQSVKTAINKALPALAVHRGWKQVLADIVSAIVMVCSAGLSYAATGGQFRLFTVQTDAEEKLQDLNRSIQNMNLT